MTESPGSRTGVLISNLGTPDEPTPRAVRRYLAEFLSDRRVIALSPLLWKPILHGIILRIRPRRSARLYRKIWTEEGSPLLVYSQRQRDALQKELNQRGHAVPVALGMRYGRPSIAQALDELKAVDTLIVLPLYPQFSVTTTASTRDALTRALNHRGNTPEIRFIEHHAHDLAYLNACAAQIHNFRVQRDAGEKLVLSFHGLPKESIGQGDPYARQCRESANEIARILGLRWDQWCITFQSRFGPKEWLTPYTDETLRKLSETGIRSVDVFCPGFSADCLETLEEIEQENQAVFRAAGGETFRYIPALNDNVDYVHALAGLIEAHMP
ncbi:MAG: ferrochelatase [Gammaproteobacteria bacterium]|nr:ferrochelatase [Gammaproteobacteria bacterium]